MPKRAVTKGVISAGTWTLVKIVMSAIATPVFARTLGAEGYGQYAYYLAVMMLAAPIANLGTSQSITKFVAEQPDNRGLHSTIALFAGRMNLLATITVCGLLLAFLMIGPQPRHSPLTIAIIIVASIALEQVWYFGKGILYGLHREELATLPATLGAVIAPILGIALAMMGWGLFGVMLGVLAANLASALLTIFYVNRFVDWRKTDSIPASNDNVLWFGVHSMLFAALSMALYKTDIILVRTLASDADAGIYAAAVQWTEFTWLIPIAIEGVMLQATSHLWAEGRLPEVAHLLARTLRYTALATGFLLVVVFVFADQILLLYFGPRFVAASLPLRILVPGVFSFSLARVVWPVIQARGSIQQLVGIIGAAFVINLLLSLLFIPRWHTTGAAIATTISYGGVVFMYAWQLRIHGIRTFEGFPGARLLVLIAISIVPVVPIVLYLPSSLLSVSAGIIILTTFYFGGALRLRLISTHETEKIIESFPSLIRNIIARPFHILRPVLVRMEGSLRTEAIG